MVYFTVAKTTFSKQKNACSGILYIRVAYFTVAKVTNESSTHFTHNTVKGRHIKLILYPQVRKVKLHEKDGAFYYAITTTI